MENAKRNFRGHEAHRRFFGWAKEKMTGGDAFDIMYGEKGKDYPKEMKEEFTALFDEMKEVHSKLHEDRRAYMEKWKEYMPEDRNFPNDERFSEGMGNFEARGEGFPGYGRRGGFGW